MSDSSITVRSTITTSVVCAVAGGVVTLAPVTAADSYTHVMTPPVIGDSVFIWFDNSPTMSGDDVWGTAANPVLPYRIAAVATTPGGCPRLFAAVGNTLPAYALTLDAPRAFSIGAPVRVTRPITYGLYQAATDNQWYLGLKTRGDAQYQFLAGPFRSYAAPGGPSGLQLRYYDNAGAVTTTKTQVARVGVTVRTQGVSPLTLGGATAPTPFRDSLLVGIALRNRVP